MYEAAVTRAVRATIGQNTRASMPPAARALAEKREVYEAIREALESPDAAEREDAREGFSNYALARALGAAPSEAAPSFAKAKRYAAPVLAVAIEDHAAAWLRKRFAHVLECAQSPLYIVEGRWMAKTRRGLSPVTLGPGATVRTPEAVTMHFSELSPALRDRFADGFYGAAGRALGFEREDDSSECPWGYPGLYETSGNFFLEAAAYEHDFEPAFVVWLFGAQWFERCRKELEEILEQERSEVLD